MQVRQQSYVMKPIIQVLTLYIISCMVFIIMRPGEGETILVLDSQREIKALEAGMVSSGLSDTDFDREVFDAGHEADYNDPRFDGKHNPPRWKRAIEPELLVTPNNLENVRAAAEATIAREGLALTLTGRRRVARNILSSL